MSIITDEEEKINDLFVRLNRSKPLTGAEIRSAMTGQIPILIKRLAKHEFFIKRIRFSVKRKQDENVAAKLLLIEFRGGFVDTKKYHLDRFVEEGIRSESTGGFSRASMRVKKVLDDMADVFNDNDFLLSSSGILNIYYWFFRNYSAKYKEAIREFLVKFDVDRKYSQNLAKGLVPKDKNPDDELLDFNITVRSPNDQGAMQRGYKILVSKFDNFINSN